MNKKKLLNLAPTVGGALLIKNQFDNGNLTGRELVYHNTNKKNEDGIKRKGILKTRSYDKDNITHKGLKGSVKVKDMGGLTYVGRNIIPALGVGYQSALHDSKDPNSENYNNLLGAMNDRVTLKARIPSWKMKITENPELMGTKNGKEYTQIVLDRQKKKTGKDASNIDKAVARVSASIMHSNLGPKHTHTLKESIKPEYIKGSKKYKSADKEEVIDYIKNNPGRFAKGVGGVALGGGLIGLGLTRLAEDNQNDMEKNAINVSDLITDITLKHPITAATLASASVGYLGCKGNETINDLLSRGSVRKYNDDFEKMSYADKLRFIREKSEENFSKNLTDGEKLKLKINRPLFGKGSYTVKGSLKNKDGEPISKGLKFELLENTDDGREGYNALIELRDNQKGKGYGTKIENAMSNTLGDLGAKRITLFPAWDGPYVWTKPKYGYSVTEDSLNTVNEAYKEYCESNHKKYSPLSKNPSTYPKDFIKWFNDDYFGSFLLEKKINKPIEKRASVNVPLSLLGGGLLLGSADRVLGKKKLYQGTSEENWKRIKSEGLKANMGGTGASKSVGNSAYQKNSQGKVHLTALRPVANIYASVNTPEISKLKQDIDDFKQKSFNIQVKQGEPGKSEVVYKLKRGYHKPNIEKIKKMESELRDLNIKQRNDFINVFVGPSLKTNGKTLKVKMDYNDWKNNMEQDREGVMFKKQMNKLKGANNPLIKNMAARGNVDIPIENISGSDAKIKDRVNHTMKELPDYIKENPARFVSGLIGATGGTYLLKKGLIG